jgi:hypothetical protein
LPFGGVTFDDLMFDGVGLDDIGLDDIGLDGMGSPMRLSEESPFGASQMSHRVADLRRATVVLARPRMRVGRFPARAPACRASPCQSGCRSD